MPGLIGRLRANSDAVARGFPPGDVGAQPLMDVRESNLPEVHAAGDKPSERVFNPGRPMVMQFAFGLAVDAWQFEEAFHGIHGLINRDPNGFPVGAQETQPMGSIRAVLRPVPAAWDAGFRAGGA